jgi:hypothetical protein
MVPKHSYSEELLTICDGPYGARMIMEYPSCFKKQTDASATSEWTLHYTSFFHCTSSHDLREKGKRGYKSKYLHSLIIIKQTVTSSSKVHNFVRHFAILIQQLPHPISPISPPLYVHHHAAHARGLLLGLLLPLLCPGGKIGTPKTSR